jgi:hypothetical protein
MIPNSLVHQYMVLFRQLHFSINKSLEIVTKFECLETEQHSQRDYKQIKFGESLLLPINSVSSVLPSAIRKRCG